MAITSFPVMAFNEEEEPMLFLWRKRRSNRGSWVRGIPPFQGKIEDRVLKRAKI